MQLSKQRARATADYLLKKGISPDRLSYKGLGETLPLNKCVNGSSCPEDLHQNNRRSEFILVEF